MANDSLYRHDVQMGTKKVCFQASVFGGVSRADIREYYMDQASGQLRLGKTGISIQLNGPQDIDKIIRELQYIKVAHFGGTVPQLPPTVEQAQERGREHMQPPVINFGD